MAINASQLMTFLAVSRLQNWEASRRMLFGGQGLNAVGMLLLSRAGSAWTAAPSMVFAGVAWGVNFAFSATHSIAAQRGRGLRAGVHEAMAGLGGLAGPMLAGLGAYRWGSGAAYLVCAFAVLLLMTAQAALLGARRKEAK